MNTHEAFACVAWATAVYLYGAWQHTRGKHAGYKESAGKAWGEGYFFKQNENKRIRDAQGRFKNL